MRELIKKRLSTQSRIRNLEYLMGGNMDDNVDEGINEDKEECQMDVDARIG